MTQKKHPINDLIIDKPNRLNGPERLTRISITLFFWLCMFYLWQPLISMVAWLFKIKLFYDHMVILGGYHSFFATVGLYLIVIFILGGGLILWAKINQWRFRGKERRAALPITSHKDIAQHFDLPEDQITQWQSYKNCTIYFHDNNHVQDVRPTEFHTKSSQTP